jgi:hypothetical protein
MIGPSISHTILHGFMISFIIASACGSGSLKVLLFFGTPGTYRENVLCFYFTLGRKIDETVADGWILETISQIYHEMNLFFTYLSFLVYDNG